MKPYILKYNKPSENSYKGWEQEALPLGNGFIGAKVFGLEKKERIQFNEKSLWSGGPLPNDTNYNGGNFTDRFKDLQKIRTLLEEGKYREAVNLCQEKLVGPNSREFGKYLSLGDINIDFPEHSQIDSFDRSLDISNAISNVNYRTNGKVHERESYISYVDNILATRISEENLKFKISLDLTTFLINSDLESKEKICELEVLDDELIMRGKVVDNEMNFLCKLKLKSDGFIEKFGNSLKVEGANFAEIYLTCKTDFAQNPKTNYRRDANLELECEEIIENAIALGYDNLKQRHIADYRGIFDSLEFNISQYDPRDTKTLLDDYKTNDSNYLEELLFQYGRYLLISSSREGENSLPANLQGIWAASDDSPWNSDYHLNINLQMNYWPAYVANLVETTDPLVNYIDDMRYYGRIAAKEYANIVSTESEENGWLCHTQANPFGWTTPGWNFYWGWSPASNAWISQNIFERFLFTNDIKYLKEKIYPILRETAKFWNSFLHYDKKSDRYVSSPSYSPEHGSVSIGNTYDQSIVEELFKNFIYASSFLELDEELRVEISDKISKLKSVNINKKGTIKEWFEEDTPYFTGEFVEENHRHLSHLVGLYPATLFEGKAEIDAAKKSLDERGDGGTGWSKANKINLWARVFDGNRAHKLIQELIKDSTLPNLWDTHPPFQIDGNFGLTSGIAEMIVQSHGKIRLLPAIPENWRDGEVKGILLRKGLIADISWRDGKLEYAEIKLSKHNTQRKSEFRLDLENLKGYKIMKNGHQEPFESINLTDNEVLKISKS